ncbi:DUF5693 family protein [Oceanobacillus halophilus]|uniref:Polysaccharide biosynthesis protein n=1 Tax=Oceanobacillus halophilus TaxID=930130 RepID=A0A495A7S5_9BACI|nr:DUF5693 family protein [Oceanobacillus halophilus]RKQ34394.1 polysaccharide biosynthesis protein [Oceanobacillus halophilus]
MGRATFIKGTIILTIATLISKVLGSLFRIPLQNIAGDEVLGIFTLVYPVYMVALILSVAGIPTAISKLIAEERAKGQEANVRPIYVTARILAICFGVISFVIIYLLSSPIANALGGSTTQLALIVVAASLLVAPYMAVYRGFFQGYGDMGPTAISQVFEQIIRVGAILGIAYVLVAKDFTSDLVAGWIMIGSVLGVFASLLYLRTKYQLTSKKPTSKKPYTFQTFKQFSKKILFLSIPIAIGSITMALFNFVDSLTIPYGLNHYGVNTDEINYTYGIYGRGLALVQIATIFATSVVLPLIPLLTEKLVDKDMLGTRRAIEKTFHIARLISWPAALGLLVLGLPINLGLFADLEGSSFIAILGLSSIFTSLTVLTTGILQGINLAKQAAFLVFIGVLLKAFSNIYMVQILGLMGAAISTLLIYLIIYALNSLMIYKRVPFSFINVDSMKILFASIIMAGVVGLPTIFIHFENWSRLQALLYVFVAFITGITVYFFLLFFWKVIKREDLRGIPVIHTFWKERRKMVVRQKWIWMMILLLLLISSPSVYDRWNAEGQNNTYEIVAPFEEIHHLTVDSSFSIDEVLSRLKEAGLTTVSINPITIKSLEKQGIISLYTGTEIEKMLLFSKEVMPFEIDENGYYITIPEEPHYQDLLVESMEPKEIVISGVPFYYVPEDFPLGLMLHYDESIVQQIERHNLKFIFRVPNDENLRQSHLDKLLQFRNRDTNLLFSGEEVVGYPETEKINTWMKQLNTAGFHFYMIEFSHQRGFQTVARNTDYDILRLHSMNLTQKPLEENINQAVRAVKERNIRSLFFHLPTGDPEESIKVAESFVSGVVENMPSHFNPGSPKPIEKISISIWTQIALLLAGILFTYSASRIMKNKWFHDLTVLLMICMAGLYLALDKLIILQAFALVIAIITPIFAVIATSHSKTNTIGKISLQYIKALGISVAGIFMVIGLLNGNAFVTGIEVFRGVKLVYVVPILFVALYLFGKQLLKLFTNKRLLQSEVKYWHLFVGLLITLVGIYYVSRTGNTGLVSDFELILRNKLEEWLYVRPRTKEFLIGFPFYLLGLYVMNQHKTLGNVLLLPGTIGFLSMMNTFTHFHIPLYISFLRTLYSVMIGYLIGLLLIYVYKKCYSWFSKIFQSRWS